MTRFYGLKPWDIDQMTLREINEYRTQLRQHQQDQQDQARRQLQQRKP